MTTTTRAKGLSAAIATTTLLLGSIVGYTVHGNAHNDTSTAAHAVSVSAPAHIGDDSPGWDCRTMGNHLCGTDYATWDEPNAAMPSGYEHMYGQLSQMPAGSVNVHPTGQH